MARFFLGFLAFSLLLFGVARAQSIPNLPVAGSVSSTDPLAVWHAGGTKQATAAQLVSGGLGTAPGTFGLDILASTTQSGAQALLGLGSAAYQPATAFDAAGVGTNSSNQISGTLPSGRISGAYSGLTLLSGQINTAAGGTVALAANVLPLTGGILSGPITVPGYVTTGNITGVSGSSAYTISGGSNAAQGANIILYGPTSGNPNVMTLSNASGYLNLNNAGIWTFSNRPSFNGATPWDTNNLTNLNVTINGTTCVVAGSNCTVSTTGATLSAGGTTTSGFTSGQLLKSDGTYVQPFTLGSGVATALGNTANASGGFATYSAVSATYIPQIATKAALAATASTAYTAVNVIGYYAAGDAPPAQYLSTASACSLNSGAGDGGGQIPSSDGKCWVINLGPAIEADPRRWGAKCDQTTDDNAAYTSAMAYLNSLGGGILRQPPKACLVAVSANLTIPSNVTIYGNEAAYFGNYGVNNATAPYTLLHSSSYNVNFSNQTGIIGVRIVRQGISNPATLRQALTEIGNFAGTGLNLSNANDVQLDHVLVNGFATAINTGSYVARLNANWIGGDDTSGLVLNYCTDTCTVEQQNWHPFITSGISQPTQTSTISALSSGPAGVIEVTLSATPTTPFVTGDTAIIYGNVGVPGANGRFTVTAIDNTHITLNGTSYSGSATTLGSAYLTSYIRTGPALTLSGANVGGELITNFNDFGHDTSLLIGANHGAVYVTNAWLDGDTIVANYSSGQTVGINNLGYGGFFTNFNIVEKNIDVVNNYADPMFFSNSWFGLSGCVGNLVAGSGALLNAGTVVFNNVYLQNVNGCTGTSSLISIQEGATAFYPGQTVLDNGAAFSNAYIGFASSADLVKVIAPPSSVFGAGAPSSSAWEGAQYFNTSTSPYTLYVYHSAAWRQVQ